MALRFPLHIHISTLFVILISLVGSLIGWLAWEHGHRTLETTAQELTARINRETQGEVSRLLAPAEMAVDLLAYEALNQAASHAERLRHIPYLRTLLANSPALTAVYVGYPNGDFFLLRRFSDDAERQRFAAPAGAAYLVQSIESGTRPARGRYIFLGAGLGVLLEEDHPEYPGSYDPRQRSWFTMAKDAPGLIKTAPYVFFSNSKVGMTLATRARGEGVGVVGADILLETLAETLARQKVTPSTHVVLHDAAGRVIVHQNLPRQRAAAAGGAVSLPRLDRLGIPVLARVMEDPDRLGSLAERSLQLESEGGNWRIDITPLALGGSGTTYLLTAIPDEELLAESKAMVRNSLLATIAILLLAVPVTWLLARNISGSIRTLVTEAESIRHFDFSTPVTTRSLISEVDELARTMASMKRTIRRFLDLNLVVAAEEDFDRLLPRLLDETMQAAEAGAGILYLSDQGRLVPAVARRREGDTCTGVDAAFPEIDENDDRSPIGRALAGVGALSIRLEGVDLDRLGLAALGGEGSDVIAAPLRNRQHQTVGALLLFCPGGVEVAQTAFVGALSGSAAVTLEAREMIRAQKALFEAFIQMIAGAIDAKSSHTGGHCARVPELAKMLARAACEAKEGVFSDFSLDQRAWEALHIAAWLHDCGKITTPDSVVDKATKLETLYDRLHEIRMRFEVCKRDAEIACLEAIASGADPVAERSRLAGELARIDDDFAFVARCNEGGESLADTDRDRLHAIAARQWKRTLDNRIGLGHEERERLATVGEGALPVMEPLLADRPEHKLSRRPQERIAPDNPWGFRLDVPEWLQDRGELHNLTIRRGTLNDEERYKINEHIVQTIIMLSQLPFPKPLRDVPEIAGGHHEKMDGTGYPRRLRGDEMSLLARMMAIADIFEALTAVDRPYKRGKKLSESLAILARMRDEGHIDAELFALFVNSGIPLDYARRFMRAEQVDDYDAAALARRTGA